MPAKLGHSRHQILLGVLRALYFRVPGLSLQMREEDSATSWRDTLTQSLAFADEEGL